MLIIKEIKMRNKNLLFVSIVIVIFTFSGIVLTGLYLIIVDNVNKLILFGLVSVTGILFLLCHLMMKELTKELNKG